MADPDATIQRIIPPLREGGSYGVAIHCPYCRGIHEHGLGRKGDSWGHRIAHCQQPGPSVGYYIRKPGSRNA